MFASVGSNPIRRKSRYAGGRQNGPALFSYWDRSTACAWPQTGTRRAICRDVRQPASHETTDGERLMTVAQVADRLQVHRESVRRWIRQGRLRGSLVGGDRSGYRIDAREVRRFVAEGVPDAVRAASSRQ
jgi:excisionase family DNA binding protein